MICISDELNNLLCTSHRGEVGTDHTKANEISCASGQFWVLDANLFPSIDRICDMSDDLLDRADNATELFLHRAFLFTTLLVCFRSFMRVNEKQKQK
ncbi:hypothetical protein CEXT_756601 [Caerostris extrusa]|uniref:Uncharacterized protein n=1 Tax=Caerostris extrusa TaxID=172846 RepID=A0AAV4UGQ7_CAEEX|nr:hypothetical protein CEXT_756601 [Caerostris extrusa]